MPLSVLLLAAWLPCNFSQLPCPIDRVICDSFKYVLVPCSLDAMPGCTAVLHQAWEHVIWHYLFVGIFCPATLSALAGHTCARAHMFMHMSLFAPVYSLRATVFLRPSTPGMRVHWDALDLCAPSTGHFAPTGLLHTCVVAA